MRQYVSVHEIQELFTLHRGHRLLVQLVPLLAQRI
jgi:hypothetical protein